MLIRAVPLCTSYEVFQSKTVDLVYLFYVSLIRTAVFLFHVHGFRRFLDLPKLWWALDLLKEDQTVSLEEDCWLGDLYLGVSMLIRPTTIIGS